MTLVKYKIEIDRIACLPCAVCYILDPSHFEIDKKGKAIVIGGETDSLMSSGIFEDEEIDTAREAEASCPIAAITVTEL